MKETKISESGMIGQDGRLRLPMDRINAFCAENKGKRVIVRFVAAEPHSSAAQLAYYYNYVLPTVQTALACTGERMTEQRADVFLLSMYPGDVVRDDDDTSGALTARQLNQIQMFDFLEWLKQWAAENLYIYIDDPKTI